MKGKFLKWLPGTVVATFLFSNSAPANDHFFPNVKSPSDIVVQEVRWPYWHSGYYNTWLNGSSFASSDGANVYFYNGLVLPAANSPDPVASYVNYSFWAVSAPVNNVAISSAYAGPTTQPVQIIGEGTTFRAGAEFPFWRTNTWYRMAFRVWQPADGTPHTTYAGTWIRDGTTGIWYHQATARLPFAATGLNSVNGFQEDDSSVTGPQETHYRRCYYHYNGNWNSASNFTTSLDYSKETENAGLIESNSAVYYLTSQFDTNVTGLYTNVGQGANLNLSQPAQPVFFDPILVTNAGVAVSGNQLLVQWQIPPISSPQFSYTVNIYTNADHTGNVVASAYDSNPEARQTLLQIPSGITPYAQLIIVDLFNQTNAPVSLTATNTLLSAPVNLSDAVNGLNFAYYEPATGWSALPNFTTLTPVSQGSVNWLDLTPRRHAGYAFNYTGYLNVASNGLYTFDLNSDAGSALYVDGQLVVNWDGVHSPSTQSGWIGLQAGYHAINVRYFSAGDGYDTLTLSYSGPGITNVVVPPEAYFRVPSISEPSISLTSPANGSTASGTGVPLAAAVTANGNTISNVQFYAGNNYFGQAAAPFNLSSFFWANNSNALHARLFYNRSNILDSPVSYVNTTNMTLAPWQYGQIFFHNQPGGASIQGGNYAVIGDGVNLLTRQVSGDCTLVAHLTGLPGGVNPDGSTPDSGFEAGIILRGNTNMVPGYPWGKSGTAPFTAVFGKAGGGAYYQDETMVNGGGGFASGNLGSQKWLKLQRAGNVFISSVSPDGNIWTPVFTNTLTDFGTTIYAGLFSYVTPSATLFVSQASWDNVNLTGANVLGPVSVTISPQTNAAISGLPATFSTSVIGPVPTGYQWQLNGTDLPDATNASYTIGNASTSDEGNYTVIVGSVTSAPAVLLISAPAGSSVWTNVAGGSWAAGVNWNGGQIADGVNAVADFSTLNLAADATVSLDGTHTIGTLIFDDLNPITQHNWTVSTGTGGTLTLAASGGTPTIVVKNATNTINAVVAGSQGFNKSGAGYLTLAGVSTFTGTVIVNTGTLEVQNKSGDTPYTIAPGATLKLGYSTGGGYANTALAINGSGVDSPAGFYLCGGKNYDANGQIQLLTAPTTIRQYGTGLASIGNFDNTKIALWCSAAASGSLVDANIQMVSDGYGMTVQVDAGTNTATGDLTFNGPLNVTGSSLYKRGTGSLVLRGAAASGNTGISLQAGAVICGAVNCLGINATASLSSGATLVLNGFNQTVANLSAPAGSTLNFGSVSGLTVNNAPTLAGTLQLCLSKDTVPNSSKLIVTGGTLTEGGSLIVNNIGTNALAAGDTFILFSASGYAGNFTSVSLPVLPVGLVWESSNLSVNGTLTIAASGLSVWSGGGANGNWSTAANWNGTTPENSQLLTFQGTLQQSNTNDLLTAAGQVVFDNGGFVLAGNPLRLQSGLVNQAGSNVWNIATTLTAAQSFVSSNGTLLISGAVTNNGADLTLDGAGTNVMAGIISGAGDLVKTGAGIAVLNNSNAYTGNTIVTAGKLVLGNPAAIPGGTGKGDVTVNGTLDVAGFSPVVNNLTGTGTVHNFKAGSSSVLNVNVTAPSTFSGVLQNTAETLGLTKSGSAILTLSGTNTYAGPTTISSGTLALSGGNNILPTNTTANFTGNSTLDLGVASQVISNLNVSDGVTAGVAGTSGTLTINGAADFRIGGVTSKAAQTADFSALANFNFTQAGKNFDVGGQTANDVGVSSGTVTLAGNNVITAAAFGVADAGGYPGNANTGIVNPGNSNVINANTVTIAGGGGWAANGTLAFRSGAVNPTLTIRNTAGTGRATVTAGYVTASDYSSAAGTIDLLTGIIGNSTLDAQIGTLTLGKHTYANANYNRAATGTFIMGGGLLDVTNLILGQKNYSGGRTGSSATGTFSLNGGTVKANVITLGDQTGNNGPGVSGTFNLNRGVLMAQTIQAGAGTASRVLNWNGGTITNYDAVTDLSIGSELTLILGSNAVLTLGIGANRTGSVSAILAGTGGGLTKAGDGTLMLLATNTYTGNTMVGGGTLALRTSSAISHSAGITISGGATFDVSATAFALTKGQVLSNASSTALLNGNINASAGTLSLTYASGTPAFNITNGTLTLAATTILQINNIGSPLSAGSYKLISVSNGGTVTGTMPSSIIVGGNGLGAGSVATLQLAAGELDLVVSSSSDQMNLVAVANRNNLNLSWPSGYTGWRLLRQTNHLNAGVSANPDDWDAVSNSINTNQVSVPIDPVLPAEFYKLVQP